MAIAYGLALNNDSTLAYGAGLFEEVSLSVPVITLVGAGMTVNLNDTFVDLGYSATDENDGDITNSVVVTGTVDTSTAGTYTLRYNVTNSVGNSATEVIRLVTVQDFWEYTPPQNRIYSIDSGRENLSRDPDSTLTYWFDMSALIGGQTIASVVVDPDSELTSLTVNCSGVNSKILTDNNGATYPIGSMIGFCLSNGVANAVYKVTIRYTLSGGDVDDKTFNVHMVES